MEENNTTAGRKLPAGFNMTSVILLAAIFAVVYVYMYDTSSLEKKTTEAPYSQSLVQQSDAEINSALLKAVQEPVFENYFNLGVMYYAKKKFSESVLANLKALELNPESYLTYNNLGAAYNDLAMYDKAILCFEKALKLKPDFQLAKNNMNWALQQNKNSK